MRPVCRYCGFWIYVCEEDYEMGLPMAVFIDCFLAVCLLAYHLGLHCPVAVCLDWRHLHLIMNKLDY